MGDANDALLESWQLSLHDRRPRTVAYYLDETRRFAAWLAPHGSDDLAAVTRQDIRLWIADSFQRGMKPNTVRSRFMSLRAFYRWAVEEGELDANPTEGLSVAKGREAAPQVLTEDQITGLLKACEGAGFRDRRDMALFRLMLAAGLRSAEAVALEPGDLDLLNRLVVVRDGKGGKARVGRFDPPTAAAIDRYKRMRARHRYASLDALWLGERGKFTKNGVADSLDSRSAKAGIGHVFPHQLRHSWAHRYLDGGGQEGDLMLLGGWEDPTVMRRYGAAQAVNRALGAYDGVNPMRGV